MDGALRTDGTRQYYDENAESYASTTLNVDLRHLWSVLTEKLDAGALILDLGCGAGRDLKYFADHGYPVVGIDYSSSLARIARQHSRQRVVCADFRESLPFSDGEFDAVWSIASLLHVPREQISGVLQSVARVLKARGTFLASVKKGTGERTDEKGRHFADYQPIEWRALLEKADFEDIEIFENEEHRPASNGGTQSITWLVSVCAKSESACR